MYRRYNGLDILLYDECTCRWGNIALISEYLVDSGNNFEMPQDSGNAPFTVQGTTSTDVNSAGISNLDVARSMFLAVFLAAR